MSDSRKPGQVEITVSYLRHVGPMFVHGGLTLQFDSLQPFSFASLAQWPDGEDYEQIVREAVEKVLREHQGHLRSTRVVLKQIEWNEYYSSRAGFERAATAATRAALEV